VGTIEDRQLLIVMSNGGVADGSAGLQRDSVSDAWQSVICYHPNPVRCFMLSPFRHSVSRRGFTLVELLTVIAIIGLLAAILIPVAAAARHRAHTAGGISNIRQLVIAHYAYAADNKNLFPRVYMGPGDLSWQSLLEPYVTDKNGSSGSDRYRLRQDPTTVFNVPDSKPRNERPTNSASIARNFYSSAAEFRANLVPDPSRYILLGECEEANKDRLNTLKQMGATWGTVKGSEASIGFRRADGTKALMGFCDASVRAVERSGLRDDITPANGNPWRWW
jgi:prepilin-type N-terminal cleavage/methylation domain-containing protein